MTNGTSMTDADSVTVEAIYRESPIPEFRGNPLIEALPVPLASDALESVLTRRPSYAENETQWPEHLRRHAITRLLFDFFEPFDRHFKLEESISGLIRMGYVGRNPARNDLKKHILNGYERVQRGEWKAFTFEDAQSTASSTSLIGCSGIGKTWALNGILGTYPHVIFHRELQFKQVVRLKLDCPKDGSLKALCMEFFIALDKVLGTEYFARHCRARASVDDLLILMAQKANQHCLGILVIDEIQHLDRAKSGGAENMLNFFVTLCNTIGVPVVLVGTHKATDILQRDFRQARRAAGMGDHVWDRLRKGSRDWNDLIEALWPYQWMAKKTLLTEDLKDHLYDLTQGVVDVMIKLFALAQHRAISLPGDELLLVKPLFDKVMEDSFEMVKPMLQALRFDDSDGIKKYGDLYAPSILERLRATPRTVEKKRSAPGSAVATPVDAEQVERIASMLRVGKDVVEVVLDELLATDPDLAKNNVLLIKKVLDVMAPDSDAASRKQLKSKTKHQKSFRDGDLRLLHKQATEEGEDIYELLQEANWIKEVGELEAVS